MGNYYEVKRQFQKIFIDFLGPYPRSKDGNCYLFIALDQFSKFVFLEPMRDATSRNVCKFLETQLFNVFSVPETIVSDNAKQFTSKEFAEFLSKHGVVHQLSPRYHPQANDSERVNRSILSTIIAYVKDNYRNWDRNIPAIGSALRNVVHESTMFSPYFLTFGQNYISHGSQYKVLRKLHSLDDRNIELTTVDRLTFVQQTVINNLRKAYQRGSTRYNLRTRSPNYRVGQTVFVKNYVQSDAANKVCAKLCPKFKKAIIHKCIGNVAFELRNIHNKTLGVYHSNDLRP